MENRTGNKTIPGFVCLHTAYEKMFQNPFKFLYGAILNSTSVCLFDLPFCKRVLKHFLFNRFYLLITRVLIIYQSFICSKGTTVNRP